MIMILLGLIGLVFIPVGLFKGSFSLVVFGVVLIVSYVIHSYRFLGEVADQARAKVSGIIEDLEFNIQNSFISTDHSTAMSICEDTKRILLVDVKIHQNVYYSHTTRIINFLDLVEAKVVLDSEVINSNSRSIVGAVAGGALFGGVGAVIGGLGGSTKTSKPIKTLELELVINDISSPTFHVNFYNKKEVLSPQHPSHDKLIKEINEWYRKCIVIIHQKTHN